MIELDRAIPPLQEEPHKGAQAPRRFPPDFVDESIAQTIMKQARFRKSLVTSITLIFALLGGIATYNYAPDPFAVKLHQYQGVFLLRLFGLIALLSLLVYSFQVRLVRQLQRGSILLDLYQANAAHTTSLQVAANRLILILAATILPLLLIDCLVLGGEHRVYMSRYGGRIVTACVCATFLSAVASMYVASAAGTFYSITSRENAVLDIIKLAFYSIGSPFVVIFCAFVGSIPQTGFHIDHTLGGFVFGIAAIAFPYQWWAYRRMLRHIDDACAALAE